MIHSYKGTKKKWLFLKEGLIIIPVLYIHHVLQITLNMLHSYYLPFYKCHITMQIRNTIAFNIWIYIRKTMLLKNL